MPGPPPNKYAKRRNARPDWVVLPIDGFDGPIPNWPLAIEMDDAMSDLWLSIWRTPQAAMWANSGVDRVVARYVVAVTRAEDPETTNGKLLEESRHLEDRLGLSPMAMKRLQWELDDSGADSGSGHLAEVTRIDRFAGL